MEYNIYSFVSKLKDFFLASPFMPYMYGDYLSSWGVMQNDQQKHPNRSPQHLKDMIAESFADTTQFIDENMVSFDLGNERMEQTYPYYHILQQAQAIRKAHQGTTKSKGSQANVFPISKRDYEKVSWNGKIYSKEYNKKVRNKRKLYSSISYWDIGSNGMEMKNKESGAYSNQHYHYIDNILNEGVVMKLAQEFGMKVSRRNTGLEEEYYNQEMTDILDILNSHGG